MVDYGRNGAGLELEFEGIREGHEGTLIRTIEGADAFVQVGDPAESKTVDRRPAWFRVTERLPLDVLCVLRGGGVLVVGLVVGVVVVGQGRSSRTPPGPWCGGVGRPSLPG